MAAEPYWTESRLWLGAAVIAVLLLTVPTNHGAVPNAACLQCISFAIASTRDTAGCIQGYCGPFRVSKVYWVDAGKPVFPDDNPERNGAYEDCSNEYTCATTIVKGYMARFGRDCNHDGAINCDDFAMIHLNGGFGCEKSLGHTNFSAVYEVCRPGTQRQRK